MPDPHPPSDPKNEPGAAAITPSDPEDVLAQSAPRSSAVDKIPRQFGRYRIQDCLGRGGMGAVFKAHDSQLDRMVALKVPFLGDDDEDTRQRFQREARAAATLHHANICPVFDVGEYQGIPYLTMAFLEGRSLSQVLEAGQSFTPMQTALLLRKVALAMQEAHSKGVVHRDLKPSNILLRPNGEPTVMDFGLARRGDDKKTEGLTRKGDIIGTLDYMSPEQAEGEGSATGPPADIYALGVVLYELLTGRRPFTGGTTAKLAAILFKEPIRPSELRAGVPARLEEICLKAMAKKPADRYATMGQLAAALGDYVRANQSTTVSGVTRSIAAPSTPPPSAPTQTIREGSTARGPDGTPPPGSQKAPSSATRRPRSGARRKKKKQSKLPWIIGGAALAVVSVVTAVVIIIVASSGSEPEKISSVPNPPQNPPGQRSVAMVTPSPGPGRPANPTTNPPPGGRQQPQTQPKPEPRLALSYSPEAVPLKIGEPQQVTIKVERKNYDGQIKIHWTGPKELHVSPAGPLTLKANEPDKVLTLRLLAEPSANPPRLEITAEPERDQKPLAVKANLDLQIAPGPCARVIEVGSDFAALAFAFASDTSSFALIGGGSGGGGGGGRPGGGQGNQGDERNAIHIWNLSSGEVISKLTGHTNRITGLAVSADGKTALSASADETMALWDLVQARLKIAFPKQKLRVQSVAISPDARRGLIVYPGLVMKVNLENLQPIGQLPTPQLFHSAADDAVRAVAVSAERKGLVGGNEGRLFLLDSSERTRPKHLKSSDGPHEVVLCATFSPNGSLAATGGGGVLLAGKLQPGKDNAVYLWDVSSAALKDVSGAALKWKGEGHNHSVVCVAFSPDGRFLASGAANGEVKVWDVEDGKSVVTFKGHTDKVLGLAFTPDGKSLWSGSADRTLRQWRLNQ